MELRLMEYVHECLPECFVPYFIYSIVVDDIEVGRLVFREGTDEQCYYDGHIGYSVFKEFRGQHYAYKACLLLRDMITVDHLIITCDPDNVYSRYVIEKLGCEYIETRAIPVHLKKLFPSEEKEKMVYLWKITS